MIARFRFAPLTLAMAAFGALLMPSHATLAADPGSPGAGNTNPNTAPKQQAAVGRTAHDSKISLQDGLGQAGAQGKPISGKFDDQNGKVLLSIVTATGNGYKETVVDPDTGQVLKTATITDQDDLDDAQAQNTAMDQASKPLQDATDDAVQANNGFVAISVIPDVQNGHPVAEVTLTRDGATKTVTEKLD